MSRVFSIPYNGCPIDEYLVGIEERGNIHSVFCDLPFHPSHVTSLAIGDGVALYSNACANFLRETEGCGVKRLVTLNRMSECCDDPHFDENVRGILKSIEEFRPDGVVVASFKLARALRQALPDIEIDTSCNSFINSLHKAKWWRDEVCVSLLNPPRSSARNIPFLRSLRRAGHKLKVIVNEYCVFGCPMEESHCSELANGVNSSITCRHCCYRGDENLLRSVWLLPRWLNILDKYVDVYKIRGRNFRTQDIFYLVDLYASGGECDLDRIIENPWCISTADVPDKLLYCGCNDCDTCSMCTEFICKARRY